MVNPWMTHLAKVRNANKGKSLKQCMILAKKSYKKGGKKGGRKGCSLVTGGSIVTGGKIKKKKKKRKGGLFKAASKQRSNEFSEDVFEGGMALSAAGPLAPVGLAMMGGAAIGSGIVNALDAIF